MTKSTTPNKVSKNVGFYTASPFWADARPDFTHINSRNWLVAEYMDTMKEEVVQASSDNRKITVDRDGLIHYEDDMLTVGYNEPITKGSTDEIMARIQYYTNILNALDLVVVDYLNTIPGSEKMFHHVDLTHNDIISFSDYGDGNSGYNFPTRSLSNNKLTKRTLSDVPHNMEDDIPGYVDSDTRPVAHSSLIIEAIHRFFDLSKDQTNIFLLSQANSVAAGFMNASFSSIILTTWLSVESYLSNLLQEHTSNLGSPRFNRQRRDRLKKELTVSEVIEILEITELIDHQEYSHLNKVRKIRNNIVHNGHSATYDEATLTLELFEKIITKKTGWTPSLRSTFGVMLF